MKRTATQTDHLGWKSMTACNCQRCDVLNHTSSNSNAESYLISLCLCDTMVGILQKQERLPGSADCISSLAPPLSHELTCI